MPLKTRSVIGEGNNRGYSTNNRDSNRNDRSSGRDPVPLKTRSVIGERNNRGYSTNNRDSSRTTSGLGETLWLSRHGLGLESETIEDIAQTTVIAVEQQVVWERPCGSQDTVCDWRTKQ